MEIMGFELECLLDQVIAEITGKSVSVAVLGKEVSVNVEGHLYHFNIGDKDKEEERLVMGQWWYGRQAR